MRAVLRAAVSAVACTALLGIALLAGRSRTLTSLIMRDPATTDPTVMTFGAAHWDSTRLPGDMRNPDDQIRMRGGGPLTESVLASHLGDEHLPEDRVRAARSRERHVGESINNAVRALDFVGGGAPAPGGQRHWLQPAAGNTGLRVISRDMAGQLADNSAAALREQSFRWALDDCKKESSCESLLGKKLYNVLQTKSGKPNLAIYHDQDDDRKDEERAMENDYRSAHEDDDGESQSRTRWQKLQGLMHKNFRASAPTTGSVMRKIDQINAERIPAAEKRILVSALMRKSSVARRAASMNDAYRSETSLIFPGNSKAHWNTYKASMMPAGDDSREEIGEDLEQRARPSEADTLRKYQNKAATEMSGKDRSDSDGNSGQAVNGLASAKDSKRAISSAAQRQVEEWTKTASEMRHQMADGSTSALRSKRVAGENLRDQEAAASTQDTINDELSRYGSVFSSRADEDKLKNEEHVARVARRLARRRERRLQEARDREHDKVVAEEVKEAKSADSELSAYDAAFVPHAKGGLSASALGLTSGRSKRARHHTGHGGRDGYKGRGRQAARDFETPGTDHIPMDTAAMEERRDARQAQEIAPMVQLAEHTLKNIGHMSGHGERARGDGRRLRQAGGGKCYIEGGKQVPCAELKKLSALMDKVYGAKAADVELVSRDHSWDPTKVFENTQQARRESRRAEKRWMSIEGAGEHGEHGEEGGRGPRRKDVRAADSESDVRGKRSARQRGVRDDARDRRSPVGELLHEANVKAAEEQTKKKPVKKGSLTALSNNLGSILGW